ncbi:putative membrane protein [Helicobacter pylori Hp P-41]|nr:putative membrane protein [Helicobacter pylori Hp P-41]
MSIVCKRRSMELLRIIFHAFFNGFFGLTFSKGIILNK